MLAWPGTGQFSDRPDVNAAKTCLSATTTKMPPTVTDGRTIQTKRMVSTAETPALTLAF
jgi:hypothetical protein